MKSRLQGPTLSIARNGRIARSLKLVNAVSRTSPTKGKVLINTTPAHPKYINSRVGPSQRDLTPQSEIVMW